MTVLSDSERVEVICCEGPPLCQFQGDEAVQNANDGCPLCRRLVMNGDDTVLEYRMLAQ